MGPGPPAAPTRCITPAAPISAALPLLRTSRDGFRAILKPSYADHRLYPLNSRNFGPMCSLFSGRYKAQSGGRIAPDTGNIRYRQGFRFGLSCRFPVFRITKTQLLTRLRNKEPCRFPRSYSINCTISRFVPVPRFTLLFRRNGRVLVRKQALTNLEEIELN